jgi:hypothetical protein
MDELAGLSEEARKMAMERFRLLQPHLEKDEPLTSVAQAAGIHIQVVDYTRSANFIKSRQVLSNRPGPQ